MVALFSEKKKLYETTLLHGIFDTGTDVSIKPFFRKQELNGTKNRYFRSYK